MSDSGPLLPIPDEASAPFFDGARAGKLTLQHCAACDRWFYPVRARCPRCRGDVVWREASGRGTLFSHGRLHRAPHPSMESRLPILLAVVDLEEGVRMNANLIDSDGTRVRAGMPVEVCFENLADGIAIPVFRPHPG